MDMALFKEAMQTKTTQARFKVDRFVDDVPAMLRVCYTTEVEWRGQTPELDAETLGHINKAARWLMGAHKPGLILLGDVGNGKTTLARAICRLIGFIYNSPLDSERKSVGRFSALELAALAKDNPERYDRVKGMPLLFIDDVGVEPSIVKVWGNEISPFVDTIHHRYDRQLFTIMTSNLDTSDFKGVYGERIADRFTEMFDRIAFKNNSYRK
jgi:DNA replication protein DnaC